MESHLRSSLINVVFPVNHRLVVMIIAGAVPLYFYFDRLIYAASVRSTTTDEKWTVSSDIAYHIPDPTSAASFLAQTC